MHNRVLPLINMETIYGAILYKEVLRHKGFLDNCYVRLLGGKMLDVYKKLDYIMQKEIIGAINYANSDKYIKVTCYLKEDEFSRKGWTRPYPYTSKQ